MYIRASEWFVRKMSGDVTGGNLFRWIYLLEMKRSILPRTLYFLFPRFHHPRAIFFAVTIAYVKFIPSEKLRNFQARRALLSFPSYSSSCVAGLGTRMFHLARHWSPFIVAADKRRDEATRVIGTSASVFPNETPILSRSRAPQWKGTGVKSRGARALFLFLSYWLKRGLSSWLSRIYLLNVCKPSIPLPYHGGVKSSIPCERRATPLLSSPRPSCAATFILSRSIFLERVDGEREVMESTRTSLCLREPAFYRVRFIPGAFYPFRQRSLAFARISGLCLFDTPTALTICTECTECRTCDNAIVYCNCVTQRECNTFRKAAVGIMSLSGVDNSVRVPVRGFARWILHRCAPPLDLTGRECRRPWNLCSCWEWSFPLRCYVRTMRIHAILTRRIDSFPCVTGTCLISCSPFIRSDGRKRDFQL